MNFEPKDYATARAAVARYLEELRECLFVTSAYEKIAALAAFDPGRKESPDGTDQRGPIFHAVCREMEAAENVALSWRDTDAPETLAARGHGLHGIARRGGSGPPA